MNVPPFRRDYRFRPAVASDIFVLVLRHRRSIGIQDGIDFRVIVEGPALSLRSVIRDDVYSIGREALVNAFRHSRASSIEVELEYAPTLLTIVIRDNGCGVLNFLMPASLF